VSNIESLNKNLAIIGGGYVGKAIANHWQSQKDKIVTITTTSEERISELFNERFY
jgi:predicted dinucleotide-binding enzyme